MKALKIAGIVLGVIILIVAILAIVAKDEIAVERSITINKPKQEVFEYIKMLKNQDNFSYWSKQDPAMKKEYRGTDGTVGFVSAWEGNDKVGKGEQEIKSITEGERIDYELRFLEPYEATNYAFMTTTAASDSATVVKWGFSGKAKFPMTVFMVFMDMDKMLGDQLQTGLANLKTILEK
jgi:hypothetical protein